ncbi:glycerophosphoryl diester phosphodiesterase [Actinomyces vulturis]|uniref:glycerophosphoryl diester phosphodiesterase n=1 Tax=Actinomyces vulturis TaxID=1857645 RepID=UPI00083187BB|nr:glycerophosphoryl diester phosphodiesterase [Actinomyces vulturis]
MSQHTRIIAHRGLNTVAPENTMPAFQAAYEVGARWIETDVDILGDGTAIICHDTLLDRTTNRSGLYYDLTAADLPSIDAGSWFGPEFAGTPMPTLEGVIDWCNTTGMNANIEIKPNEAGAEMTYRLLESVCEQLDRLNSGCELIVSSFNHVILHRLHSMDSSLPLACLYEKFPLWPDWKTTCELVGARYIHPDNAGLTRHHVQQLVNAGLEVNVWTVNSVARANELFNWGVSGVFTDACDKLIHLDSSISAQ